MPPKRKRGPAPDASESAPDASIKNSKTRDNETGPDADEDARPKKRGRKPGTRIDPSRTVRDEQDGPSKPERRRPPKDREGETRPSPAETQKWRVRENQGVSGKGEGKETQINADVNPPSSEHRRSGRDRRQWDPAVVFSARRPSGSSPTQYSSPPNKPSSKSKPRTAKQKEPSSPQKEPRSSTPRRGARERRSWDPERVYGNRVSEEHSHPSRVDKPVSKQLSKTRVAEGVSKAQKSKEKTRQAQPKADADDSLREGSSRSRRATEAAGDTTKPRRRGRPKLSDSQVPGTEPQQSTSRAPRRKMSSTVQQKPEQEPQEPPTKRRKRKAPQTEAEPEAEQEPRSDSEDEHISFRHLKESVRNIERAIVDSKWERLDAPSIGAVASILAEAQRPVLLRLQTTNQRREHASAALSHVSRRLVNKLGRGLPFPAPIIVPSARANSGSHMEDFDFERTVDTIQNLENTLNPLLHSVTLLEKEIKKEEGALNKEYESLHRLEANARSKAAEWRDKTRREHPLVPDVQIKAENDNKTGNDVLELVPIIEGDVIGGVFQGLEDEELVGLSKQIGSHMESMKGNLQQIGGVVPAINRSKAALRQVLTKHLKEEKYSSVLLG